MALRTPRSLRSRWNRSYWLWLALIILVGVAGRIFHFQLTLGSDDQRHILAARQLGEEHVPGLGLQFYVRILFRVVLALWGLAVRGLTLETSAILMFLLAVASMVLVARITEVMFGRRAALLAAALQATYPVHVQYDIATLHDSLAVPMLLLSLFLFVKFLKHGRTASLAGAAVTAGLLFPVKEYYPLVVVPFALCIWAARSPRRTKMKHLVILGALLSIGGLTDLFLNQWDLGDPLAHPRNIVGYEARLHLERPPVPYQGLRKAAWDMEQHASYVSWLLLDNGVAGGALLLGGGLFLGSLARKRLDCRLQFASALAFFVFLSLMAQVYAHSRYMMAFTPILAIGAGGGLALLLRRTRMTALAPSVIVMFALVCVLNLAAPNDKLDGFRRLEIVGVRRTLDQARNLHLSRLVLPWRYATLLPDSYSGHGVELVFTEESLEAENLYGDLTHLAGGSAETAVFVPRQFAPEDLDPESSTPSFIRTRLTRAGFDSLPVRVPRTSLQFWADRLGYRPRGELVGWMYVRSGTVERPASTASGVSRPGRREKSGA